jgi:hypothetical protein
MKLWIMNNFFLLLLKQFAVCLGYAADIRDKESLKVNNDVQVFPMTGQLSFYQPTVPNYASWQLEFEFQAQGRERELIGKDSNPSSHNEL